MNETKRANSDIEDLIGVQIPVLDHGFIQVVDYMGNDDAITEAARVSYGAGTVKTRNNRGLINYLMQHHHTTPFEMCEIKICVKLPIFVARQWIRHRTANVNEYSARYSILDNEFYVPEPEQLCIQSTDNKQGRGETMRDTNQYIARAFFTKSAEQSYADYLKLTDENGLNLSRELARGVLPPTIYTRWFWKVDLHNLLHFLRLRTDSHAQWEIRQYADVLANIVETWVPIAWDAFEEHVLEAETFSRSAVRTLQRIVAGETVDRVTSGLGQREWSRLCAVLDIDVSRGL